MEWSVFIYTPTRWFKLEASLSESILRPSIGVILMQAECKCRNVETGGNPTIVGGARVPFVSLSNKFLEIFVFPDCFMKIQVLRKCYGTGI